MKKIILFSVLLMSAAVLINSCKKEDDSDSTTSPTGGGSSSTISASISGRITNEAGLPIFGVTVTSNGNTATTDGNGIFLLQGNVDEDRCVLQLTKAGFMNRSHALIAKSDVINYVSIVLSEEPAEQTVNASSGGTVNITGGATVLFQSNSFVLAGTSTPYTGMVNVTAKLLSVDDLNFGKMIPGGDLLGKDAVGSDVSLYSYGMIGVTIHGSGGELLQLAPGLQATLTWPIASSQQSSAPQTIPLWYFDESTNLWKEEGQATKVGNNYIGNVSHFTWWNCDTRNGSATISGRVVDCEGSPLPNIIVTVNGQYTISTNQNGFYTRWIQSGIALTFQVLPQGTIQSASPMMTTGALAIGENYSVQDITLACGSYINVSMTDCENEATSGFAFLYDNNYAVVGYQFSGSGNLRLMAGANTSYNLALKAASGETSIPVTTVNLQDSVMLGTVQLCSAYSYSNGFNIQGHGFISQDVLYMNHTSGGNYWINSENTKCHVEGLTNIGEVFFDFQLPGNQVTSIDFSAYNNQSSDSTHCFIQLIDSETAYFVPIAGNPFIVTITEYGNVGDSIKGTFAGMMEDLNSSESIFISNGKFAIKRGPDQQ
jgi:hypothetical protein